MPDPPTWGEALPAPRSPYDFDSINTAILLRCAEQYELSLFTSDHD